MRVLLQRVTEAAVAVDGTRIAEIGPGLLILACAMRGDTADGARAMADRIARLRVFRDDAGRMNRALADTGGAALVVSQFTLAAEMRGTRPGFSAAAPPAEARPLVDALADALSALGVETARGAFGADMAVSLVNDGPVTLWIDRAG